MFCTRVSVRSCLPSAYCPDLTRVGAGTGQRRVEAGKGPGVDLHRRLRVAELGAVVLFLGERHARAVCFGEERLGETADAVHLTDVLHRRRRHLPQHVDRARRARPDAMQVAVERVQLGQIVVHRPLIREQTTIERVGGVQLVGHVAGHDDHVLQTRVAAIDVLEVLNDAEPQRGRAGRGGVITHVEHVGIGDFQRIGGTPGNDTHRQEYCTRRSNETTSHERESHMRARLDQKLKFMRNVK